MLRLLDLNGTRALDGSVAILVGSTIICYNCIPGRRLKAFARRYGRHV